MNTANTFSLTDNQLVDTYGFFTFLKDNHCFYNVPENSNSGTLSKFRGLKVKLKRIKKFHYGDIIEVVKIKHNIGTKADISFVNLSDFIELQKKYSELATWTKEKKLKGYILFEFLRAHNPIYIQKEKNWIKKIKPGSRIGDFVVLKIEKNNSQLKYLEGLDCLFVATYNKGFKNGFLVLPILKTETKNSNLS